MVPGSNAPFCCLKEIEDIHENNFTFLFTEISPMGDSTVEEGKDFFLKAVILETKTEVSFVVHTMYTVFEEGSFIKI